MATRNTLLAVIVTITALLILFVAGYVYAGTPSFCGTCHIMRASVESWEGTTHAAKKVECLDCHAQPGSLGVFSAHLAGLGRTVAYFTRSYQRPKTIVSNDTCFRCHLTSRDVKQRSILVNHYQTYLSQSDIKCTDCHAQLVHKAEKSRLTRTIADGWIGATACGRCHFNFLEQWKEAKHRGALETLVGAKQDSTPLCLPCHTVGFKKGGFVSTAKTGELGGVQCENCHGKGLDHSQKPSTEKAPESSLSADTCTSCHQGTHHPTGVEWANSAHAKSLEVLKQSEFAKDECLLCHSADYRLAPASEKPGLKEAKFAVACPTCHSPHTGKLRLSREEICADCHNAEGSIPPQPVHHPTRELFLGEPVKGSGVANPPVFAKHIDNNITCVDCHMFTSAFVSEQQPAVTGHFYTPKPEACVNCHSEWTVPIAIKQIQALQAPTVKLLAELEPRIAEGKARLEGLKKAGKNVKKIQPFLDVAVFDFDFVKTEPSKGFHNPQYAEAMLNTSKAKLDEFMKTAGP